MSPRKLIFFAIVGVLVLWAGIAFSILTSDKKDSGSKWPKELSVWVFGDDVAGYEEIVKDFKSKNERYKKTEVRITKFANYADYEKTLLNVIADGNSPDVFMVPSDGAGVLESKIEPIPDQYLSTEGFGRNFNRVFDVLAYEKQEKDRDNKDIMVSYLKGVPLGYETMAAFYNLDIVTNAVPRTWKELATQSQEWSSASAQDEEDAWANASPTNATVLAGLGMGSKYVQNSSDLASLFLVQNGVESYVGISENEASKAFSEYLAFWASAGAVNGVSPNGNDLSRMKSDMDRLGLTATDLFARGKVGVVFGYPSYLREIQYSVKRASQENVLNKRNLKTTGIPFLNSDKPAVLAKFNYFALSKYAKDQQGGLDFVIHLTDKKSQESYMEKFPYVLPALNELLEKRKEQVISKDFPRVKYESFIPQQWTKAVSFDKGISTEFDAYFKTAIDTQKDYKTILSDLSAVLKCQRRHLIEWANFEEACPTY